MTNLSKSGRRWVWMGGLFLAALILAGCASGKSGGSFPDTPSAGGSGVASPSAAQPSPAGGGENAEIDKIKVGDGLLITFADLSVAVPPFEDRVRTDGTITLVQNQTFTAAGKTRGQLAQEIRERYVPDFFRSLTVTVQHQANSQFYYVGGEVKRPDRQIYMSRLTVLKAIQSVGDYTDFANKKAIELTRADGRKFVINGVKAQSDPSQDLEVYPGDKIYVPRRPPFKLF